MSDVKVVSTPERVTVVTTEHKVTTVQVGVQGPAGPSDHGELSGLSDDDHPQYHNNARGDARYTPLAHASDTANPHAVTKAQVGLGNVDNTSDVNKPVSTAQAAADAAVLAAAEPIGTAASTVSAHAAGVGVHAIASVTGLQTALDAKSSTSHDHAAVYAPIAKGVTNGDAHNHNGGDGAQIAYTDLSGLPTLGTAAATNATAYESAGSTATHAALTTTHGISTYGATLVDDAAASDARTTLGLGGAATLNVGTTTGTVAAGDDSRLSDARTPVGHTHATGDVTGFSGAALAAAPAETTSTIGVLVAGATEKATPVDADSLGLSDSDASNTLKKFTWGNLKSALNGIFARLAGVAGGQTLIGGTGASETLTLQSTSHATKGKITANPLTIDGSTLRVGIGQTSPTAALHLKAGTATGNTAPLKLTSGPLLTIPESGAVEYSSGTYYISDGGAPATRRKVASEEFTTSRGLSLITNGSGGLLNNYNFSAYSFDQVETFGGFGAFSINAATSSSFSDEYIPVSTAKRYILTLYAKSGDISGSNYNPSNIQYFGVACYDIDKLVVQPEHSTKYSISTVDTTLAATLNPGDTTITLEDATGWYAGSVGYQRNFVWYGYTNSFGYVYPDYTYTRNSSSAYSSNSSLGAWTDNGKTGNVLTLRVPWAGPSIPSGAAVRNSNSSGTYKYIALSGGAVPNVWTKYSGYIGTGDLPDSLSATNKALHGTSYIRFLHLINYHHAADNKVRISNISLISSTYSDLETNAGIGATYKNAFLNQLPANGLAVEGAIGSGTMSPAALMHGFGTTEQSRSSYDATAYKGTLVSSTGLVTETLAGATAAIKWMYSDATTNAIYNLATFSKNSAGAGAAGLGVSLTFAAKSSTTVDSPQVTMTSSWVVATHATRTARGTLNAVDYAGTREAFRWESDGTKMLLSFFGGSAAPKPTALTPTVAAAPAGGTGTAAGAWDTAVNRDLAITVINNLKTRVDELETKLQSLTLLS